MTASEIWRQKSKTGRKKIFIFSAGNASKSHDCYGSKLAPFPATYHCCLERYALPSFSPHIILTYILSLSLLECCTGLTELPLVSVFQFVTVDVGSDWTGQNT